MTLKLAIEDAIHKAAPDVVDIEAEGAVEPAPAPGLIQLDVVSAPAQEPIQLEPAPAWSMAGGIPEVPGGGPVMKQVSGEPVLFVTLDGNHYAYRPSCAACEESLEDAPLEGDELACPACGQRYDVRRAGRALDAGDLHLDPVPLLVDDSGLVKVALGSVAA
jgi:nitrite reductase/ring-hydroxylating ferredoxin subunit